jgi:hypothetical protein
MQIAVMSRMQINAPISKASEKEFFFFCCCKSAARKIIWSQYERSFLHLMATYVDRYGTEERDASDLLICSIC